MISRVGSYLSQSVYSVATPFHPFGGAVDIIVVQQQDGSFRTTPWYVRFGKFQGVLKGAEKIVKIEVNGVEADFHMYLDNSGEAYFVKEVSPEKDNNNNNNVNVNDSESLLDSKEDNLSPEKNINVEVKFRDDHEESTESDSEKRFYEFQDEQSPSLDGSIDLYDNVEGDTESHNSEVVLFSIDGQILSAPITSTEENTENVQLSTPQFHLGPVETPEFGNDLEFSNESTWAHYLSDFNRAKDNGSDNKVNLERELSIKSVVEDGPSFVTKEDVFKSCLALNDLGKQEKIDDRDVDVEKVGSLNPEVEIGGVEKVDSSNLEVNNDEGVENVESSNLEVKGDAGVENVESSNLAVKGDEGVKKVESSNLEVKSDEVVENVESTNLEVKGDEGVEKAESLNLGAKIENVESLNLEVRTKSTGLSSLDIERKLSDVEIIKDQDHEVSEWVENSSNGLDTRDESVIEMPQQYSDDNRHFDGPSRRGIELSLCGNLLRPGMGLSTAADTFNAHRIHEEEFRNAAASIIKNDSLIVKIEDKYFTFEKVAHIVLGKIAYGLDLPVESCDAIPVELSGARDDSGLPSTPSRRWRLWPIPFRRVKTLDHNSSNLSGEDIFLDSESVFDSPQPVETTPTPTHSPKKQFVRTNAPTTEQIASLNLKDGQNMVSFIFSTRVLGVQKVDAHIYLWKWNARIVISDVDGTITKSDVLGQFMPLVGKDWTQSGVARLFSAIKENGYQLLFLSARAIVQAYLTRSFLLNLKQDGKALPNGPVVISPDGLFPSLFREVIRRAPHEFKIACLEDIKALFPADYNPFYAGFGNRDTDELSYRKIGIPKGKIFIINPKGEVAISHRMDMKGKSYTSLHTLVNDMFPPTSMIEQEDFNSWNYWRVPLPDVEL
ncbi:phosphatidate phosphatase PAH1-like isoform X2 [Rutidosis leptorrhynchoides]|uniref:phosphatidate phosphatase PAH1-like isoform X2 n=1 Tax=Rutidosis leptorrhynchoides TaxID=125765 RepID=UPI003A99179F